jgi:hypothetical protein
MPAIHAARLKAQAHSLAEKIVSPLQFVRDFTALMEQYADYTHRIGQTGQPVPLLTSFNTPTPVLRQVWIEIKPVIAQNATNALTICDLLWKYPYLEHRLLAADILGQLPNTYTNEVINRLRQWIGEGIEEFLIDTLFTRGLTTIRDESPRALVEIAQNWLSSSNQDAKNLGLRLLQFIAANGKIDLLPSVFRLLSPYARNAPAKLRPVVLTILSILIDRSPPETAYMLRQNLVAENNPDAAWILRRVLSQFPDEYQKDLRQALRNRATD